MTETPIFLGDNQLFCIVSKPKEITSDNAIVILNAGLLNSPGPYRLHVRLAEELSARGYVCVRFDQSGKGESQSRKDTSKLESIRLDYKDIQEYLNLFGIDRTILIGLCSGADDALQIIPFEDSISGAVMSRWGRN